MKIITIGLFVAMLVSGSVYAKDLVHDAEFYILKEQNGQRWAEDDKRIEIELEAFRKRNGGKPPNVFYILSDDIGVCDRGID